MLLDKKILCLVLSAFIIFPFQIASAVQEQIEGLEYDIRLVEDVQLDKSIKNKFSLYELYFENKSNKTYSIPGYSIDLGIDYLTINDINSLNKDKNSKKLTIFNVAAGAASLAFGGIVRSATNTAMRTFGSFKKKSGSLSDNNMFLSNGKTYILYPGYGLSLFLFVDNLSNQVPNSIRFVCHEEDTNQNYILVNDHLQMKNLNADNNNQKIAAPAIEQYK